MRLLILAAALCLPAIGSAQKDQPEEVGQYFVFDGTTINGRGLKVPMIYIDADQRVKFERIVSLKKDFLPKLKATAKSKALR